MKFSKVCFPGGLGTRHKLAEETGRARQAAGGFSGEQEATRVMSRKESVRFDSFRFRTFRKLIGLVRFDSDGYFSQFDAIRPAFFGRVVARSSSVRFISASGSGRFQN